MSDHSLWAYFYNAGPVVKFVMLVLVAASLASWTFIIQRFLYLRDVVQSVRRFEDEFWSGADLASLYNNWQRQKAINGLANMFCMAYKEFVTARKDGKLSKKEVLARIRQVMRISYARQVDKLEMHLPFLASVGSTSPYIGLFGTVWGIMAAFHALGSAQQATIAMVAPGISEALIATAMGLFAAIPAVLAYNRLSHRVNQLLLQYDTFQEEFTSLLERQIVEK